MIFNTSIISRRIRKNEKLK